MATFWMLVGLPIAIRTLPRSLCWFVAPAIGWAATSVLALPLFSVIGMSVLIVNAAIGLCAAVSIGLLWRAAPVDRPSALSVLAMAAAAMLALVPIMAVLPKETADGVVLAAPSSIIRRSR